MSSYALPSCPSPYPPGVENLTRAELARLGANEKCRAAVRAEVCRRLKDSPNKANYLTFRWFLPADEEDRADAFNGLCACCWKATRKRIFPYGLFPRTGLETRGPNRALLGGSVAKETQEDIRTALVDCLYGLKALSDGEVILRALDGGFETDVDVANAVRQGVREDSKYLAFGDDSVSTGDEGEERTRFDDTPDYPESTTNAYNDLIEIVVQEKAQVVEELGEKGWTAWEGILEFVDSLSVAQAETGSSQNERDFQRSLTAVFEQVYGVKERQASTHKSRLLAAIKRIAQSVQGNDGLKSSRFKRESNCEMKAACRESCPAGKGSKAETRHRIRTPKISKENHRDRASNSHLSQPERRLQSGRSRFY